MRPLYIIEELREGSWEACLTFDSTGNTVVCCYAHKWLALAECDKLEEMYLEGIYRVKKGIFEGNVVVDVKGCP